MPTRRDALKTLAGATVVGSLSGCVQFATQRSVEYHGTPAMISLERPYQGMDDFFAFGVGIEARRTIERFGVTKEIVTHNWGMVYTFVSATNVSGAVVTFTSPSIKIAGQEMNPIAELTVGDIADEFASTVLGEGSPQTPDLSPGDQWAQRSVDDATGKKVLGAFRDSVGGDGGNGSISLDVKFEHISNLTPQKATAPGWDGDTYEGVIEYQEGGVNDLAIRFDKHNGDFVIVGWTQEKSDDRTNLASINLDSLNPANARGIAHPSDDDFTEEMLRRHLVGTNLQGAQGMVGQARNLIGETQDLLAEAKNNTTRDEEDARFSAITATEDDLKRLDTIMGGLGGDFSSLSVDTLIGGTGNDTLRRVQERSEEAETIATRAHERIANYNNDTRDEEDARFLQIEENLGGIEELTNNSAGFTASWVQK